ncbi:hypothetical protein KI387_020566, partial [Taxus chinensis]
VIMVQGGFYGGMRANMGIKKGGCFERGVHFSEIGFGFKEGGFSQSKTFDAFLKVDMDEGVCEGRSLSCKRAKYHQQQWSPMRSREFTQYVSFNPLEESSPLGLTLKKTPSFLDLIEMKLSQGDWVVPAAVNNPDQYAMQNKDANSIALQATGEKLKASNFPASFLRIGSWERISRHEGDLVAKCYYAKRKLVWEVLECGLKSKIEIQWSDITSLKASYQDSGPGTLEIEVSRAPMFCRETNPQPRKHTLWQPTSDFTGGQASICRRHILQFNQGILKKHYEKILQCDHRLNLLSKEGITTNDLSCFDSSAAAFQVQGECNCYGAVQEHKSYLIPQIDHLKCIPPFSSCSDNGTPMVPKIESVDSDGCLLEAAPEETPSPSSECGTSDTDELYMNANTQRGQLRFAAPFRGLQNQGSDCQSSKSTSTLDDQIDSCISEHKCSHNLLPVDEDSCQASKQILYDIAQHLLSDSLVSMASDEQKIMARIDSMSSLIEKDISGAYRLPIDAKILESSELGYCLGTLEKGGGHAKFSQRNDDTATAFLNRGGTIGSHAYPSEDGYM